MNKLLIIIVFLCGIGLFILNPNNLHFNLHILLYLLIGLSFIYSYSNFKSNNKIKNKLGPTLDKNVEILNNIYNKYQSVDIKKNIKLFTQFNILAKVSKCDYITFLKYDYMNRYISMNFQFTLDQKSIVEDTLLYEVGHNLLTVDILKFDQDDLHYFLLNDIKNKNTKIYQAMIHKGTKKIYYQNVYKDNMKEPYGIITISFKDDLYTIPREDKIEILRIIKEINFFI